MSLLPFAGQDVALVEHHAFLVRKQALAHDFQRVQGGGLEVFRRAAALASGVVDVGAGVSEDAGSVACAPADNADRIARVRSFIEFSERVGARRARSAGGEDFDEAASVLADRRGLCALRSAASTL